jgi:hypothetical protein
MLRLFRSQPVERPARVVPPPGAVVYHYDPKLGNPSDKYTRADVVHKGARRPEVPAVFVAYVEGETIMNTMWGRRAVHWLAEPGTPCIILGYWADGTVHLIWPAIGGTYRVDGRFPAWVATEDPTARMAGGGRIMIASEPSALARQVPANVLIAAVIVLVVLVLLVLPPTRDALSMLASDLFQLTRYPPS